MKTIVRISMVLMLLGFSLPQAFCSEAEDLLGFSFNSGKKEITIVVVTKGCTQKNDFSFVVKNNTLTIFRKRSDDCKGMQTETSFTYSLKEVGIDANKPFKILNNFVANAFVANIR